MLTDFNSIVMLVIGVPIGLALIFFLVIASIWFVRFSAEHRTFGAAVFIFAYLLEAALGSAPSLDFGLSISTNDAAVIIVLLALLVRSTGRMLPLHRPILLVWLGFSAIIVMNLMVGLGTYGAAAGVEIRPTFGFLVAATYFCMNDFTQDEVQRMARWCTWAGYGLLCIALYRWVSFAVGLEALSSIQKVGAGNEFRALRSDAAFFVAMVSLGQFLVWLRGRGTRLAGFHALAFGVFALVLQHRSVWVSYALVMLLVLLHQHKYLYRRLPVLITFFLVAIVAAAIATTFGIFDRLFDSLIESAVSMADSNSTATDRLGAWDTLLSEWVNSGTWEILFGFPFGYGFRWYINHVPVDFTPHNFYVLVLLRAGICGFLLFLVSSIAACVHALSVRTRSETDDLIARCLGFMLFAALVYYIPYGGILTHGSITGLAMGLLIHNTRELRTGVERSTVANSSLFRANRR